MSAIFGLVQLDGQPAAPDHLARMAAALTVHGPDGGAPWHAGPVGLGQRRLWVTPADAEEQPPGIGADPFRLVVDGRLHNRPELLAELRADLPAEAPDSAILRAAYARWGGDCVHRLCGVFTLAIWDDRLHQLLVVRSAVDSPSLFFHAAPHRLAFATMPKGLFALPDLPRRLDEEYLADYLARTGTEPAATFYAGIRRLLPGQRLVVRGQTWSVQTYWTPDLTRELHYARDEEYVDAFTELFDRVVQDHLRSRTPVGVMLSGGLDSTSVAAVAAQHLDRQGRRLAAFTEVPRPGFDGAILAGRYADETPFVQAMARRYANLDLNLIHADGRLYLDDLDVLFAAAETPFPNASNRVWYEAILAAAQAQGVRHILVGAGGNLTISWHGNSLLAQLVGAGQWGRAWREARAGAPRAGRMAALRSLLRLGVLPHLPAWVYLAVDRLPGRADPQSDWRRHSPIHPDFAAARRVDARARDRESALRSRPTVDPRPTRLRTLLSGIRRGDGLAAGYQARFGVTVADPTADARLVEFCLAVPESQYRIHGRTRQLIRRAMADRLPREVLDNRGRGLQAADWYERLAAGRPRVLAELDRLARCELARRALDLPRLRELAAQLGQSTTHADRQMIDYRGILERGLMTGGFIRWVEGDR